MTGLRFDKLVGLSAALILCSALSASATTLAVDGSWLLLDDCMSEGQFFTGTGTVFPAYPTPGICDAPLTRGTGSSDGTFLISQAQTYTWTSLVDVVLDITDWSVLGDKFEIWIDSADPNSPFRILNIGSEWQDIPGCDLASQGFDVTCHGSPDSNDAFADPLFAGGQFLIGQGSRSLIIKSTSTPFLVPQVSKYPDSTVAIRVSPCPLGNCLTRKIDEPEPVPEPASLFLLASGLVGGALRVRRRRKRAGA